MGGIIAAIRGGPASKATVARAIVLAKETGLPLTFFYVVNLDFMSHTMSARVHTISEEMEEMGEFILLAAQSAASEEKVDSEGIIRHGNVRHAIIELCHEFEPDYLVLGMPRVQKESSHFTEELLAQFIAQTEEQTGTKVVLPDGEDR